MDIDRFQASLADTYLLERELGAGGMARVFVAKEIALGRKVVIKVLPPEMSSTVLAERFRREVSLAAQLRHPHIIPLLTAGDAGGLLYYTMPFVEGETLRARLTRDGPIPAGDGVHMLREIAYALSYAHDHGVVHRDIKPENILLENGHAVVADFGVAKALVNAATEDGISIGPITTAGVVMGTVTYMAPEQAAGDPAIDHRVDLYALGVVAYEIFSGAPPFRGSAHQVIAAHMAEEPEPLLTQRPDLSPALAMLTMQLLAKDPAGRPATAATVVGKLDEVAASGEISTLGSGVGKPGSSFGRNAATRSSSHWITRAIMVSLIALAVAAGAYVSASIRGGRDASDTDANSDGLERDSDASAFKSVAVLPFVNTSGDVESEHFSNGLTDELISALGQVHGLRVAARTSVFAFKGRGLGVRAIAETLGVATVIEGSARRDDKRLKITAQLVNAADGTVLWSETFDRQTLDVFAVQEEISRAIVGALNVRLTQDVRSHLAGRPTNDLEAYDMYLKGVYNWNKSGRTREGMETSLAHFQNAVQRDPKFAHPYAGMADAYVAMSNFSYMPVPEAMALAETAADRALALDPLLAEAHSSKGFVLISHQRFPEAEREFLRAIQLNPSYAAAHHFYSLLLMMVGRTDEAAAQNRLALSLDPLSIPVNANRGIIMGQQRKYADARRELRKALPVTTGNALAPSYLGVLEAYEGRYAEALPLLELGHRIAPGFPGTKGALAHVYARIGRRSESDSILAQLRTSVTDDRSRIQLAFAEAMNGGLDRAYSILQRPATWDVPTVIVLRSDPLLTPFRADRRYSRLLTEIGLKP